MVLKVRHFMEFRFLNCFPIQFQEPGIFRLLFSGLPLHGWQQVYIMLRQFRVYEPKFQKLGVNFLFSALACNCCWDHWPVNGWVLCRNLDYIQNFWFGHQGYEYVDLGRFWQIFLFVGLIIWLLLMGRAIWPALKQKSESKNLLILFLISTIAIAAFYGAGLMWGRQTNLAVAEYWRWWVVHLWVEGFFEVFAAVVVAFLFVRLQILKAATATTAVLFSTIVFLVRRYTWDFPSSVFYRNTNSCYGSRCNFQCT